MSPTPDLRARLQVGDLAVDALSDGVGQRAFGPFFAGVDPADWMPLLGVDNPDVPVAINFGAFLVHLPAGPVLIDSGLGARGRTMAAHGGELLDRLREVGIEPGDVSMVIHTHLHTDHCGWNVDDDHGHEITFPNATFHVSAVELEHWLGDGAAADERTPYVRSRVLPLRAAGRVRTFSGEARLADGIFAIPTPGHTPGHSSILITSGSASLVVLGDVAHHPVHLEHPDWVPAVDLDPVESLRSRERVSAIAVELGAQVTGGHFPILTLGRLTRVGMGRYRWVSE